MTTSSKRAAIHYLTRRVSTGEITERTGRDNRYILMGFAGAMGDRALSQIGRTDIERWQATIRHLAPGTRRLHFGIVRSFLDDLVERGTITRNPARPMPPPKVPRSTSRALNPDQVRALFAAASDELARCMVALHFQCALRRAEVAGIELGDINWSALPLPEVHVTGKGGHSRRIPLPQEAQEAIAVYLTVRPGGGGPLLRQRRDPGLGVTAEWVGAEFSRIAYRAGVKQRARDGVGSHSGRHTCATDVYRRTGNVKAIQKLLGHASLDTTNTYVADLDNSELAAAMEGRTYRGDAA